MPFSCASVVLVLPSSVHRLRLQGGGSLKVFNISPVLQLRARSQGAAMTQVLSKVEC